jgi:hypothetical protein
MSTFIGLHLLLGLLITNSMHDEGRVVTRRSRHHLRMMHRLQWRERIPGGVAHRAS